MTLDELTPYWDEFKTEFMSFAIRHAGEDIAEDAMSEAYYNIARILPDYQHLHGKRGLFGWMQQVLLRTCLKMRTRENERKRGLVQLNDTNDTFDYTLYGTARRSIAAPTDSDAGVSGNTRTSVKRCIPVLQNPMDALEGNAVESVDEGKLEHARRLVNELPISGLQRETLNAILDGLSPSLIADRLGVSLRSVLGRYERGIEALRALTANGQCQPA